MNLCSSSPQPRLPLLPADVPAFPKRRPSELALLRAVRAPGTVHAASDLVSVPSPCAALPTAAAFPEGPGSLLLLGTCSASSAFIQGFTGLSSSAFMALAQACLLQAAYDLRDRVGLPHCAHDSCAYLGGLTHHPPAHHSPSHPPIHLTYIPLPGTVWALHVPQ